MLSKSQIEPNIDKDTEQQIEIENTHHSFRRKSCICGSNALRKCYCFSTRQLEATLFQAVQKQDVTQVIRLLERGVDCKVHQLEAFGKTPLHLCGENGSSEIAELLLECGANVESKCKNGMTPLIKACVWNRQGVCQLLIEHGADVNAEDNDQNTPLMSAARYGNDEIVKMLIESCELTHKAEQLKKAKKLATTMKHKGTAALIARISGSAHCTPELDFESPRTTSRTASRGAGRELGRRGAGAFLSIGIFAIVIIYFIRGPGRLRL